MAWTGPKDKERGATAAVAPKSNPLVVWSSAANVRENRTSTRAIVVNQTPNGTKKVYNGTEDAVQRKLNAATSTTTKKNKAEDAVNTPTPTISALDTSDSTVNSLLPYIPPGSNNNAGSGVGVGLFGYRWNLPPHKWSLPVEPSDNHFAVNTEAYTLGSSPRYRRGRIYWYSRVDTTNIDTSTYNTGKGAHAKDPRYGFQFLWNPDNFTTSASVNMDITPSFADKFVDVVGAFPSGEYLSVSIRLDRTNDFACIRSLPANTTPDGTDVYARYNEAYSQYYSGDAGFNNQGFDNFTQSAGALGQNVGEKILELQKYGTIADLEYLYKAINGPGWTNSATGKDTSDIGFLMPTLLRIDIGPLSYLGYVNNINVNHTAFSKGMVPIRTDVSLQFNLMATAGLSSR